MSSISTNSVLSSTIHSPLNRSGPSQARLGMGRFDFTFNSGVILLRIRLEEKSTRKRRFTDSWKTFQVNDTGAHEYMSPVVDSVQTNSSIVYRRFAMSVRPPSSPNAANLYRCLGFTLRKLQWAEILVNVPRVEVEYHSYKTK